MASKRAAETFGILEKSLNSGLLRRRLDEDASIPLGPLMARSASAFYSATSTRARAFIATTLRGILRSAASIPGRTFGLRTCLSSRIPTSRHRPSLSPAASRPAASP